MADMKLFGMSVSRHVMILGILGIILVIAGIAVTTIHSSLRVSGLGTDLLVLGFLMLLVGVWWFATKH